MNFGMLEKHLGGNGKMPNLQFYKDKRVFLTGHTGFKGAWLTQILVGAGAKVTGYSLAPNTNPNLYEICNLNSKMHRSIIGDVRDFDNLKNAIEESQPEIVFHLAAQPLVRESYNSPRETYETNVMGTVNLLECIRTMKNPPTSVLNVTTDKVYLNREWAWGYREDEMLDGFDPYSNSKSCSELATHSYINSFFESTNIAVSTARAGNVIGGGDFSKDRIVPDCVNAAKNGDSIIVRNPYSTRPYQHVLEPLFAYMMIAERQYQDKTLAGYYNVGPDDCDCVTTGELVDIFCKTWENVKWIEEKQLNAPHEANFLKLDCTKLKTTFNWKPEWNIQQAITKTCEWSKIYFGEGDISEEMNRQIRVFMEE